MNAGWILYADFCGDLGWVEASPGSSSHTNFHPFPTTFILYTDLHPFPALGLDEILFWVPTQIVTVVDKEFQGQWDFVLSNGLLEEYYTFVLIDDNDR